jgi:hypothetical protein
MPFDPAFVIVVLVIGGFALVTLADFGAYAWVRGQLRVPTEEPWHQGAASIDARDDAPSADQVYFDSTQRALDNQISTWDVLDTKTAGAVGVGSTILPLTFGLLSISRSSVPGLTLWLLGGAVVAYFALLILAARTSHIRGFEYRPKIRTLWENSQTFDGAALRRWVAEEYAASSELNRLVLEYKARWVGRVTYALYAEGILISAAAGTALLGMQA